MPNFPVFGAQFSSWGTLFRLFFLFDFPLGKSHLSAVEVETPAAGRWVKHQDSHVRGFLVVNPLNEIAVFHETSLKELSLISFNLVEITIFCYQFCSNLLRLLTSKGTRNNHFPSLSDEQMSHYLGVVEHQRVFHSIFAKTFQSIYEGSPILIGQKNNFDISIPFPSLPKSFLRRCLEGIPKGRAWTPTQKVFERLGILHEPFPFQFLKN